MEKNKLLKRNLIGGSIFIAIAVVFFIGVYFKNSDKVITSDYNTFMANVDNYKVSKVVLSDSAKITFYMKDDNSTFITDNPRKEDLKEILLKRDIEVVEGNNLTGISIVQSIFSLLFFAGGIYFIYRINNKSNSRQAMALNAQDVCCENDHTLNFNHIAGNEEAKESVEDVVDFIKNPEKYFKYGARMPRGLIFYGPPGTGKTLMAKAIAGEAGVPFYAVSGSDFVQMYVGVGAGRIRELFKKARESRKAVIFIDEIDALGKKRSSSPTGANDERDQTLNALLTEMSGFNSYDGIIVIAATNRLDTLDEALLRPGRFDRQIEIGLPDLSARETIIKHHATNKPVVKTLDIKKLAKNTVFFSGAMIENLLNEAAIIAAKNGADEISEQDIDKAYYTVIAGSEKKDRTNIKEQERKITAFHEAGHALISKLASPENTVSKITIIPSTKGAGGFCVNIPPDKMYYTKKEIRSQIMINFAGRVAEEIIFGEENITTGASNDIEKATSLIKDYVSKFGMSDKTGLLNLNQFNNGVDVIEECKTLLNELYQETKILLNNNSIFLHNIANELLDKETLNEEDLDRIVSIG